MTKVQTLPEARFIEIVATSLSFNEITEKAAGNTGPTAVRDTKERIQALGLSIAHFGRRTKYKTVRKKCPVCSIEFDTKDGGKEAKVCCGHQCANTLAAQTRNQAEITAKIAAAMIEIAAEKRKSGEYHENVEKQCERCGENFQVRWAERNRRFCSRACSWISNRGPDYEQRQADKALRKLIALLPPEAAKAVIGAREKPARAPRPFIYERKLEEVACEECGKKFDIEVGPPSWKRRRFCSSTCSGKLAGRRSAASRVLRSQNETLFAELCATKFDNITCNEPIFNGWDADVILNDQKIAILWNGAWHYKPNLGKNHSLKQVQNRDRIKLKEIKKAGFVPYVIKDLGKYNPDFVVAEFEKFLEITGK